MKSYLITSVMVILICLSAVDLSGQVGYFQSRKLDEPRFDIDLTAFRSNLEGQVKLELYYKIYNDGLRFFKKKDHFVANYELNVIVLGEDNKQLTGASVERFYRLDNYRDTRNPNDFLINLLGLETGKGKFKVVCKLIDKNSNKISSIEKVIEVKSLFKDETDLSQIQFIREVLPVDSVQSRFDKGEKRIIPAVTRVFGEEIKQISFYIELYHEDDDSLPVKLKFNIEDARKKKVYDDQFELTLDKPIIRFVKHIPLEELAPSDYNIEVSLTEESGRKINTVESEFTVDWSLTALVRNDYDLALNQLKYVARKNEIDKLKNAPEEERETAFKEFWKSHDPTPATPENELMNKYYGRIKHANKVFSNLHKEGWKTDMGKIFIIYGDPDHVEIHPFELSEKPYQVWYYYSLSRTFGFVDEIGTGEYRLQFPYDGRRGYIDDRIDDYD